MIQAMLTLEPDEAPVFLVALSFANLQELRDHPMDACIKIPRAITGLDSDIMLVAAESEDELLRWLRARRTPPLH